MSLVQDTVVVGVGPLKGLLVQRHAAAERHMFGFGFEADCKALWWC